MTEDRTNNAQNDMQIRDSIDADIEVIHAIYGHNVLHGTASWEYEPPSVEEMAQRRANVLANGFPYIVAVINGRVVGYAYASTYRARIGYRFVVEDSVYVDTTAQGKGVGRTLLEALITRCKALGYRQMIAVIGDSDNAGSIKLHAACGFEHVGTFKGIGEKFGRVLDSVQMQRALVEG
jgi:phosphinothricin acetyltransferase